MKKIIMSVVLVLFVLIIYFLTFKNVTVAGWTNKNIEEIKQLDSNLKKEIDIAKEKNVQEYPSTIKKLENSIDELKKVKEKYEDKVSAISNDIDLGIVHLKEYKIERLWVAIENYAKDENVNLKIDVMESTQSGLYDLQVTAIGSYIGITDFIYDIEKDDTLGFKILNFKMVPHTIITGYSEDGTPVEQTIAGSESTTTSVSVENSENNETENLDEASTSTTSSNYTNYINVNKLKATFKIEAVSIDFD